MLREAAYVVLGIVIFLYSVEILFNLRDDPREPPRISPRVPLLGHILGLMRNGTSYYGKIRYVRSTLREPES